MRVHGMLFVLGCAIGLGVSGVQLDDCQSVSWGGTRQAYLAEDEHGGKCLGWKADSKGFVMHRNWKTPINGGDANALVFDMYVSDEDVYYTMAENSLELTSSGRCDVEETACALTSLEVSTGWNRVVVPLSSGGCDLSRVNYMRLYTLGLKGDLELRLANIRLEKMDPSLWKVELPPDVVLSRVGAEDAEPVGELWLNRRDPKSDSYAKPDQVGLIQTLYGSDLVVIAQANVLGFGAKGDGVADETEAFQRAIASVSSSGGGVVFVPVGRYRLSAPLTLPVGVGLIGDLEPGTANGTILAICHGMGLTDPKQSAVRMSHQSALISLAFWYPEQKFDGQGTPIAFPATITQIGSESITLKNVTLVNSYDGINLASGGNNSLQHIRDVVGTCLNIGYCNDKSFDIGRIENVSFSAVPWLASGLPGVPDELVLRRYLLRNAIGFKLQRIDWTYLARLRVVGYSVGVLLCGSPSGVSNGHLMDGEFLDCHCGIRFQAASWMMLTKCVIRASGNEGARAIDIMPGNRGDVLLSASTLRSVGANAVVNLGQSRVTMVDCRVESKSGTAYVHGVDAKTRLLNTELSGGDGRKYPVIQAEGLPSYSDGFNYAQRVAAGPSSRRVASVDGGILDDKLQQAIDGLRNTGGVVLIPAGTHTLNRRIDIWPGVEVRGTVLWAQCGQGTRIHTCFGKGDPEGDALFNLHDASGLRGITVIYNEQDPANLDEYSFTIRGNGRDIYVINVALPTSYNGVDFARHRCDRHYVEYLWMAPLNIGIRIGSGSEGGIVRDCHFTPNCWCLRANRDYWKLIYAKIMKQSRPYIVGSSRGQLLYHNFVYGASEGLVLEDGAKDVISICHGVDSGNICMSLRGDCTALLVDSQFANLDTSRTRNDFIYVKSEPDFSGRVDFLGFAGWGSCNNAFNFNGQGEIRICNALIAAAGLPMCQLNGGKATMASVICGSRSLGFSGSPNARELRLIGNLFPKGEVIDTQSIPESIIKREP
jgi:hypothetical protein